MYKQVMVDMLDICLLLEGLLVEILRLHTSRSVSLKTAEGQSIYKAHVPYLMRDVWDEILQALAECRGKACSHHVSKPTTTFLVI